MERSADDVNWQQMAHEFSVGDCVNLLHGDASDVGRVVAVWPAIGQLDIQFPSGWTRKPVEEVIRLDGSNPYAPPAVENNQVPGGAGTVPVSGGPPPKTASVQRVTEAFLKKALYWAERDRQYRPSRAERDSGVYYCPKCKGPMEFRRYKRRNGITERLLACCDCMFLIKPMDAGLEGC